MMSIFDRRGSSAHADKQPENFPEDWITNFNVTFRNSSISIAFNSKLELVDRDRCCFVLDSFIHSFPGAVSKNSFRNLEGLLSDPSGQLRYLFRDPTDS
jgi:hypothetical protein